jgi:succinate-semialdehyde dehydrogenase/glutarate-semialdehyde dehydrogenase
MKTRPLFLNGTWFSSDSNVKVINPSTTEVLALVSTIDRGRVAQAVRDAHEAFPAWRMKTGKARGEFLQKIASELERRAGDVARTITLENGKPLAQSQAEVGMSIDHLRWFAEEARRSYGRVIPPQVDNKRHLAIRSPIGVAAAISPWNFPLVLAVRKIAPALAAGCPVILKPARQTPLSALAFAECVDAAQVPAGVFQLVLGAASEIGEEFLRNPLCRKISFTGSTDTGRHLIRGAADQIKPLSLELGGQAPLLVFEDADLDRAVEGALAAKFQNTGQSCIAANRIYAQRPIYRQFVDAFVTRTTAMKVGDGLDPAVQIGPLIDEAALTKALEHIENAVNQGARLLCGGRRLPDTKGFFLEPAVLVDVPDDSLCMHEETFAPVAPITPFDSEAEAVRRANATPFGLSAYVFTRDINRAFRLMEDLEAGMIGINDGVPTTSQAPFGGVKQSGWGRELGFEGLDAFLETKHISLRIS